MRTVILLRGINLGPANRLAMADLRAALADSGIPEPRTLLQSGNVVVEWDGDAGELAQRTRTVIAERFGLEIPVVIRTAAELAAALERNPFVEQAQSSPKWVQVTFLAGEPDRAALDSAVAAAKPGERLHVEARELYSWHPHGIADSKLALALTARGLRTEATSRNWTTVTKLLKMATDDA